MVGGLLLGPSVFGKNFSLLASTFLVQLKLTIFLLFFFFSGRIPGFTAHIFPPPSLPYLNLVATIGLIFFLFLVGLEVDFALFRKNVRAASSISFFGMVIPFALGAAVSKGIYDTFVDSTKVKFGVFLLFIGTAK